MRLLLDTHAMYWYIEGAPQLSPTAQVLIQDATNEVLISPASYWEIAIKISIGKWQLNQPYERFVDIALNQYGFQALPILPTHTAMLIRLPFHHRDPFDRLLVSQAMVEGIPIVGNDRAFDAYGISRLW
ncbi:MAG: type II toxin-antitoxin system VapC family toxin [Planctomycetaceae bacterium]|nr:MAG: type II toxin-antitoxin system VapC family toxin [Planctomycetaceae bacterium]